jgi:hypothetical protein
LLILPDIGQIFAIRRRSGHDRVVQDAELVDQVAASTGLPVGVAARVVEDVLAFYRESVEDYVRRRHGWLQAHGMRNPEIFATIAGELGRRVVAAPPLTERQLRRVIYG